MPVQRLILCLAAVLGILSAPHGAQAAPVLGTLMIDFRLEWGSVLLADGTSSDGTLHQPFMGYWDRASGAWIDVSIAPSLPSFSSPYQNSYTVTPFPLPDVADLPYGGVLSYYTTSDGREGMIVGLSADYVPVEDFDALFNPQDFIINVSEADAIDSLKNPVPGTVRTPHGTFTMMVILQPTIVPRWQYDAVANTYSLSMNLYAFSAPTLVGSSVSGASFSPAATVPAPAGFILATSGILALLSANWANRRTTRGYTR